MAIIFIKITSNQDSTINLHFVDEEMKDRARLTESPMITQNINSKTWTETDITDSLDTFVIWFVRLLFTEQQYLLI